MPISLANAPTPPAMSMALLSSSMNGRYHVRVSDVNTNVFNDGGITGWMDSLASRLIAARELRKLTQTQLGKSAGVSQSTIGNIEAGIRDGAASLASIANALGVRYFWLRDGEGDMEARAFQPDAQAIAEAFDALPVDTEAAIDRRAWLYAAIIGMIANQSSGVASAPAQSPASRPSASHRLRS